jgi:death on curing protein
MKYLSAEDILQIHSIVISETGGSHGFRDREALLSIAQSPRQSLGGKELYSTVFLKAALYAREIIMRHAFVDGNKRTGMSAAFVFLADNGYLSIAAKGDIEAMALRVIHERLTIESIAGWLKKNTKRRV